MSTKQRDKMLEAVAEDAAKRLDQQLTPLDANAVKLERLKLNDATIVARGRDAWHRLATQPRRSWNDYMLVADALEEGRRQCRAQLKLPADKSRRLGRAFNTLFSDWIRENGFGAIDGGTRSLLTECLSHREEIEAFLESLPTRERLFLNYPGAVLDRWRKTRTSDEDEADSDTALQPQKSRSDPRHEITRLRSTVAALQEELDALSPVRFDQDDPAEVIADILDRAWSDEPRKAEEILGLWRGLNERRKAHLTERVSRLKRAPIGSKRSPPPGATAVQTDTPAA